MAKSTNPTVGDWILPDITGWKRTARPDDPDKYLMISADCHCVEPGNLWYERIDHKYRSRLPRVEVDENGVKWAISEGWARSRLLDNRLEGEDHLRSKAGADPEERLKDQIRDGVDAEIIFPNKGLSMWATPDADFAHAQCRVYNDWAWETFAQVQRPHVADGGDRDGRPARARSRKSSASRRWASAA